MSMGSETFVTFGSCTSLMGNVMTFEKVNSPSGDSRNGRFFLYTFSWVIIEIIFQTQNSMNILIHWIFMLQILQNLYMHRWDAIVRFSRREIKKGNWSSSMALREFQIEKNGSLHVVNSPNDGKIEFSFFYFCFPWQIDSNNFFFVFSIETRYLSWKNILRATCGTFREQNIECICDCPTAMDFYLFSIFTICFLFLEIFHIDSNRFVWHDVTISWIAVILAKWMECHFSCLCETNKWQKIWTHRCGSSLNVRNGKTATTKGKFYSTNEPLKVQCEKDFYSSLSTLFSQLCNMKRLQYWINGVLNEAMRLTVCGVMLLHDRRRFLIHFMMPIIYYSFIIYALSLRVSPLKSFYAIQGRGGVDGRL